MLQHTQGTPPFSFRHPQLSVISLGAQGIVVPLVNTAAEAQKAVAAAKYPPQGVRGFCFSRMNNYGLNFNGYAKNANDNIAVVIMIESREAVENIDEILEVEGVDGVFIGPYDMSGSYDLTGQIDHEVIRNACRVVVDACARHHKSAGLHLVHPTPESITQTLADGFTFIAIGVDMVFLNHASSLALKDAKQAMREGALRQETYV